MSEQNAQTGVKEVVPEPRAANTFNFLFIVVAFAFLGPPIGWTFLLVVSFFSELLTGIARGYVHAGSLHLYPLFWMTGIMFSYAYGGALALLAGFLVASGKALFERFGLFHALIVGVAIGGLIVAKPAVLSYVSLMPMDGDMRAYSSWHWAAMCLVSTIACWYVTRSFRIEPSRDP